MLRNFYKMKTKYTISKWHFVNNDKRPLLCFFVFIPVLKFPLFHLGNFKNFKSDLKNIIPNFPHNDVTKVFFTLEGKVNLKVVSMVRIFIFKMVGYQHWRRKKKQNDWILLNFFANMDQKVWLTQLNHYDGV